MSPFPKRLVHGFCLSALVLTGSQAFAAEWLLLGSTSTQFSSVQVSRNPKLELRITDTGTVQLKDANSKVLWSLPAKEAKPGTYSYELKQDDIQGRVVLLGFRKENLPKGPAVVRSVLWESTRHERGCKFGVIGKDFGIVDRTEKKMLQLLSKLN
jgi:hypothetical protein